MKDGIEEGIYTYRMEINIQEKGNYIPWVCSLLLILGIRAGLYSCILANDTNIRTT